MHFASLFCGGALAAVALAAPSPGKGHYHPGHHHFPTTAYKHHPTTTSKAHPTTTNYDCGSITKAYAQEVVHQFVIDGIIPDLIELNTLGTPSVVVNVTYGTKAVDLGTYFTTTETTDPPTLSFTAEEGYNPYTTLYMVFLIDPDVPQSGSPAQVNFAHWIFYNAQPQCVTNQTITTVDIYEPLTPASTTQHRYTFLVYRQPPGFTVSTAEDLALNIRTPFDLNDYTEANNLILVGGNYLNEAIDNGLQGS